MARRTKFPSFWVIVLIFAIVWFLSEIGWFRINIPWLPLILGVIALGAIVNNYH